jgi:hypothetical protein
MINRSHPNIFPGFRIVDVTPITREPRAAKPRGEIAITLRRRSTVLALKDLGHLNCADLPQFCEQGRQIWRGRADGTGFGKIVIEINKHDFSRFWV